MKFMRGTIQVRVIKGHFNGTNRNRIAKNFVLSRIFCIRNTFQIIIKHFYSNSFDLYSFFLSNKSFFLYLATLFVQNIILSPTFCNLTIIIILYEVIFCYFNINKNCSNTIIIMWLNSKFDWNLKAQLTKLLPTNKTNSTTKK